MKCLKNLLPDSLTCFWSCGLLVVKDQAPCVVFDVDYCFLDIED
jgi:hypothetical protein